MKINSKSFKIEIRKKVITCFVVLTAFISLFFIVEGYFSAQTLARQLELNYAHKNLLAMSNMGFDSLILDKSEYVYLSSGKEFGNIKLKKVINIQNIKNHEEHEKKSDAYFFERSGKTYIGLNHSFGSEELYYIKEMIESESAIHGFIKRSLITSSIVFWLCIWVSIYVAVILSRFITSINKDRVLAAYTEHRTGLKNAAYLEQKAQLKSKDVIIIDITDLSRFEEAFGAKSRDSVLIQFSKILIGLENKGYMVGHYEYSRFYLVCKSIPSGDVYSVLRSILLEVNSVISVSGIDFKPSLVLGASSETDTDKPDQALSAARYAKHSPNNIAVFNEAIEFESRMRLSYSSELVRAIEKNEFILLYQPKVDLLTGAMVGAECLVRWDHPRDGLLSPDKFIDLIPTSHISNIFTINLISLVIKQIEEWKKYGFFIGVSINAFPFDLASDYFISHVKGLVIEKPWLVDFIELELLESETSVMINEISNGLNELKRAGIICSIDDFGTGMSSLAYLKSIPVSIVKIDKEFIQDISFSVKSETIVKGVVSMAKDMNWTVIAEGVESQAISNKLVKVGIELAQGYHYSRPVSASKLLTLFNPNLDSKYLRQLDKYKKEYEHKLKLNE